MSALGERLLALLRDPIGAAVFHGEGIPEHLVLEALATPDRLRDCAVCGRSFAPLGQQRNCSVACAREADLANARNQRERARADREMAVRARRTA